MSYMPARHQGPAHRDEPLPPTDDPLNGPLARTRRPLPRAPTARRRRAPPAPPGRRRPLAVRSRPERPSWAAAARTRARRTALHDGHRLPRPARRARGVRAADLGLAGQAAPLDRRHRSARGWVRPRCSTRATAPRSSATSTGPARSPSSTPRAAPPRRPACWPPATPSAPSAVAAWSPGTTTRPAAPSASGARAAGHRNTTRELLEDLGALQRRLPVADRRPRRLRPLAGRRPLRRARLRRAARRHRHDPGRRTSTRSTSCSSGSTGSSSSTPATTCGPRTGWPRPRPPTCWW